MKSIHDLRIHPLVSALFAAGVCLASASAQAGSLAIVSHGGDSGEGSLRMALQSGASHIVILPSVQMIYIDETLSYSGTEPLTILGSGQRIKAYGEFDMLALTAGADLTASDVSFIGPDNFSIESQGEGKGIFIDVPEDRTGVVRLSLTDVSVSGFAYHGVHVSDCSGGDDCGSGQESGGTGSPASVVVHFHGVDISDVGNGRFDGDGLRVDERSEGGISFQAYRSSFTWVGADGLELDEDDVEGSAGSVVVNVSDSRFDNNGAYCDPELLEQFLPEPDEAEDLPETGDGVVLEEDITPVGTPDDACFEVEFETYEGSDAIAEYEVSIDVDDGFDIDEAGGGSINVTMSRSQINGNFDEGADFDEAGEGGFMVSFIDTVALGNTDDGFKLSEEDDGDLLASMRNVQARSNGGKGAVFEEEADGDLHVMLERVVTNKNDDGEVGIEAVQEDDGTGTLAVSASNIKETEESDGIEADGVQIVYE